MIEYIIISVICLSCVLATLIKDIYFDGEAYPVWVILVLILFCLMPAVDILFAVLAVGYLFKGPLSYEIKRGK